MILSEDRSPAEDDTPARKTAREKLLKVTMAHRRQTGTRSPAVGAFVATHVIVEKMESSIATVPLIVTNPERGTVTIGNNAPSAPQNEEFLDALASLNANLTLDEYTAPVPESVLRRKKSDD